VARQRQQCSMYQQQRTDELRQYIMHILLTLLYVTHYISLFVKTLPCPSSDPAAAQACLLQVVEGGSLRPSLGGIVNSGGIVDRHSRTCFIAVRWEARQMPCVFHHTWAAIKARPQGPQDVQQ
jgi:hypothetical protein